VLQVERMVGPTLSDQHVPSGQIMHVGHMCRTASCLQNYLGCEPIQSSSTNFLFIGPLFYIGLFCVHGPTLAGPACSCKIHHGLVHSIWVRVTIICANLFQTLQLFQAKQKPYQLFHPAHTSHIMQNGKSDSLNATL
jgi:hypothetical protein